MRIQTELTERIKRNFRNLYERGVTVGEIAHRYGMSERAVKTGLGMKEKVREPAPETRILLNMYLCGISIKEIARQVHKSERNVQNIIALYRKSGYIAEVTKNG